MTEWRVYGFRSFFKCSIFLLICERFYFSPCKSDVFITSCYPVALCVYILSSARFTSLFMFIHPPPSFEARVCTWLLWGYCLCQLLGLICLLTFWSDIKYETHFGIYLDFVYIGVTTDQFFLNQGSWGTFWPSDISWHESHTTHPNPAPIIKISTPEVIIKFTHFVILVLCTDHKINTEKGIYRKWKLFYNQNFFFLFGAGTVQWKK